MIQLAPQVKILVCMQPIDFRKGIDGLNAVVRLKLLDDPFSGVIFLFRNRCNTSIKILAYDGQGFWLCQKRLSKGQFRHWPSSQTEAQSMRLMAHEVHVLLAGGDPKRAAGAPLWRPVQDA